MSKLKITEVQVDCRELTKEQIDRMCEIVKIYSYIARNIRPSAEYNYFRQATYPNNVFTVGSYNPNNITLFYGEFVTLFDKPKFKPKKAIKELEQRITLLEQKLSEKEAESSANEAVNELPIVIKKGMRFKHHITGGIYEIEGISVEKVYVYTSDKQNAIEYEFNDVMNYFNKGHWIALPPTEEKDGELLKQAKERYKQDDVVNCIEFKDKNYGTLDFSKEGYVSESEIWVYSPTLDTNICVYKDGVWAGLKKEELPTKGSICKFWNNYEDNYEIGRYEANLNEDEDTYIHVNILTLGTFKNAKVISVDEALQLFKKQLLNGK